MNLLILILIIAMVLLLLWIVPSNKESFMALHGINPLATHSSYGTINGIYHFNDLPYYDATYDNLGDEAKRLRCQGRLSFYNDKPEFRQIDEIDVAPLPYNYQFN